MGKPGLDPGVPTCHESHDCPVHLPERLQPHRPHLFECDPGALEHRLDRRWRQVVDLGWRRAQRGTNKELPFHQRLEDLISDSHPVLG
jgi:hypothetical protein